MSLLSRSCKILPTHQPLVMSSYSSRRGRRNRPTHPNSSSLGSSDENPATPSSLAVTLKTLHKLSAEQQGTMSNSILNSLVMVWPATPVRLMNGRLLPEEDTFALVLGPASRATALISV